VHDGARLVALLMWVASWYVTSRPGQLSWTGNEYGPRRQWSCSLAGWECKSGKVDQVSHWPYPPVGQWPKTDVTPATKSRDFNARKGSRVKVASVTGRVTRCVMARRTVARLVFAIERCSILCDFDARQCRASKSQV